MKDLGIERRDPINSGFFFLGNKYIEAPYVFERRGLDLYINGLLWYKSTQEWPPFDYRVPEDPGPPPADAAPWDQPRDRSAARDKYWSRKWRYIAGKWNRSTAEERMIEALRASPLVRSVNPAPNGGGPCTIEDKEGRKHDFVFDLTAYMAVREGPIKKEKLVESANKSIEFFESALRQNSVEFNIKTGSGMRLGGERALQMIEILASDKPPAAKVDALVGAGLIARDDPDMIGLVERLEATPQLNERAATWRAKVEALKAKARVPAASPIPTGPRGPNIPDELSRPWPEAPASVPASEGRSSAASAVVTDPHGAAPAPASGRSRWYYIAIAASAFLIATVLTRIVRKLAGRTRD